MTFNFSKKHNQSEPDFVDDQAVILEVYLEGLEEFGTKDHHQEIELLEDKIVKLLPAESGVDGDEFGEGVCVIYIRSVGGKDFQGNRTTSQGILI